MPRDIGTGLYHYPDGTPGNSGQTIFSARYNTFINDLTNTLNQALPVNMGGTGGDNAATARDNIDAEVAMKQVTNYDTHVFEAGSFWSSPGATAAPTVGSVYHGVCTSDAGNITLLVRDPGPGDTRAWVRRKFSGSWTPWAIEGSDQFVKLAGDTMTGHLTLPTGPAAANAVRKDYVDAVDALKVSKTGDTMTGALTTPNVVTDYGCQFGGITGRGIYCDNNNIAIRTPGSNSIILQNEGGSITYAIFNNASIDLTKILNATASAVITEKVVVKQLGGGNPSVEYQDSSAAIKGYVYWYPPTGMIIQSTAGRQYIFNDSDAYKAGGGPWIAASDARIKTVHGPYEHGLAELLTLQPVRYTYNGNDTFGAPKQEATPFAGSPHAVAAQSATEFIGLVAQDAEVAMPELVTKAEGYIDGQHVTDLRNIDTGPLVHALINAVKELAARIEALEAGLAPP